MPAASREAFRSVSAFTAPASSTSSPWAIEAYASHISLRARRLPVARNRVPTGSPASAAATLVAAASTTGIPEAVAISAACSLVSMPPVPIAAPRPLVSTSRSSMSSTTAIGCASGLDGCAV